MVFEYEDECEVVEEKKATLPAAWNVLKSILNNNFSFSEIEEISGLAGLNTSVLTLPRMPSKWKLLNAIESRLLYYHDEEFQKRFIAVVTEEILEKKPDKRTSLQDKLTRLGWNLIGNAVIPIEILDVSTLKELPSESHADLTKAAQRLRDGDLSGAISSACAAVDIVTSEIYASYNIGDLAKASFQERCKLSLKRKGVFTQINQQLGELGWDNEEKQRFCKNFEGAINQGAYVMQTLRPRMGDVHGTKPILKPLVFDSLRWAEIILRLLTDD